ncbi:unnamed protein product [Cuscuta epithymum]|uniref:NAC domain-containing protein n=1 Tax=Cuscuta epithymum TaxID=186058 RepID=A0AAV0G2M0_9ASTE|nr:unnamed protein product [Cuscuta epithymum]
MADIPHYLNPPTDWWYKDFRFIRDWFWSMENCLPDRPLPDSINFVEEDLFPNRLKNIYEIVPDSLTTEYGPDREYFMYSLWGRKYADEARIESADGSGVWERVQQPEEGMVEAEGCIIGVSKTFKYYSNGHETSFMMDVFRPFDPHQRLGDWVLCKVYLSDCSPNYQHPQAEQSAPEFDAREVASPRPEHNAGRKRGREEEEED